MSFFEVDDQVRHINGLPVLGAIAAVKTVPAGRQGKGRATVYQVRWEDGRSDDTWYSVSQLFRVRGEDG
jgi:hypothetical protein